MPLIFFDGVDSAHGRKTHNGRKKSEFQQAVKDRKLITGLSCSKLTYHDIVCLRIRDVRTGRGGIRIVALGLKRTRNPDMVSLERLEHFLPDNTNTR